MPGPVSATLPPPMAFDNRQAIHHWLRLGDLLDTPLLERGDLKEQKKVRQYERHEELPETKEQPLQRPHQEWEMDARGYETQRFFVTGADWPSR